MKTLLLSTVIALTATFQPQAWINENAIDIDGRKEFDATAAILRLNAQQIRELKDNSTTVDQIAEELPEFKLHTGAGLPFKVSIVDALDQWLKDQGVPDRSVITDEEWSEFQKFYPTTLELSVNHRALFDRFKADSAHYAKTLWKEASDDNTRKNMQGLLAGLNIMVASLTSIADLDAFRAHLDTLAADVVNKNRGLED